MIIIVLASRLPFSVRYTKTFTQNTLTKRKIAHKLKAKQSSDVCMAKVKVFANIHRATYIFIFYRHDTHIYCSTRS